MDDDSGGLERLLREIERAPRLGLNHLAVSAALTVPDVCAAASDESGETKGERYIAWFEWWVGHLYQARVGPDRELVVFLSGRDVWKLRCAFLHQGRGSHRDLSHGRVVFREGEGAPHCNLVTDEFLEVSIWQFVDDIVEGARGWLTYSAGDEVVQRNLGEFVQRFPSGQVGAMNFGGPMLA